MVSAILAAPWDINNECLFGGKKIEAQAEPDQNIFNNFSYREYKNYISITGYYGSESTVIIPSEINGKEVTKIGDLAFSEVQDERDFCWLSLRQDDTEIMLENLKKIETVIIPDTVVSIGYLAFSDCPNLTQVDIPDSVTSFGGYNFKGTKWLENRQNENPLVIVNNCVINGDKCTGEVFVPDGVINISKYSFCENTKITDVILPEGVKQIDVKAFCSCSNLKNINIPYSVEDISLWTFSGCSLSSVVIPNKNTTISFSTFDKNTLIKCYKGSEAEDSAKQYNYSYELLDPKLEGTVYYQTKANNSSLRFVAEVNIDDVINSNKSDIKIAFNGEEVNVQVTKAYSFIVANNKTIKAQEGKCFIISPTILTNNDGADIISAEFALDSCIGNIAREIAI